MRESALFERRLFCFSRFTFSKWALERADVSIRIFPTATFEELVSQSVKGMSGCALSVVIGKTRFVISKHRFND